MTFGSLFAGIGGLDLGFERAGMKCVWQVEIDPYCRRVLAKHWPDVPKWDDVRTFTGEGLERPDVICGGFPCQDISNAGKRAGIDGERSGMWSEYARIIRVVRPQIIVVENVAALLGGGMGRVVGDLAASGYDAEWDCIPAQAVGAPYERDRVFVVAHVASQHGSRRRPACRVESDSAKSGEVQSEVANTNGQHGRAGRTRRPASFPSRSTEQAPGEENVFAFGERLSKPEHERKLRGPITESDWWTVEPDVVRMAPRVPYRVDRIRGLGNAVVPQVAEWIGRRLMESETLTHRRV